MHETPRTADVWKQLNMSGSGELFALMLIAEMLERIAIASEAEDAS